MPEALPDDAWSADDGSYGAWQALAEKALKAPIETLVARSADDIAIQPLYRRRTVSAPRHWRGTGAWRVAQRVDHPDPIETNRLALLDLEGGADALTIVVAGGQQGRGFGLEPDARTLDLALETVELDLIATRLDAGGEILAAATAMAKLIEGRRLASAGLWLDLGCDPLGSAARSGRAADLSLIHDILDLQGKAGLAGCPLLADSRPYHEAGAGPAQELAAVLATATAYLRHLLALGFSLDAARGTIAILITSDADTFFSLAKFRAIRRLWARVETACGLAPKPLRLHAETAWRMMSRIDPWVNAMRATSGIFAAGLGGADVITALPFTLANGLPDAAARRLARNAQRVLIDEAHLDAVDDPAAGSGGLDGLTDELCARSWMLFQEIEQEGGLAASLAAGALQGRIAGAARIRSGALADVRKGLVGTSLYASQNTTQIGMLDVAPGDDPATETGALPSHRESAPFEALREQVEARRNATGRHPTVFLATLGTPVAHGPGLAYAANVFAVAGIKTVTGGADGGLKGYETEAMPIACLCAPDRIDGPSLAAAVRTLRSAGATHVMLAGHKGPLEGLAREAEVDAVLYQGCNVLECLAHLLTLA